MENRKLKVVVYGLGNEFKKNKDDIESHFEVVAYTDIKIIQTDTKCLRYNINDLSDIEYDVIIVCTTKYYNQIKSELLNRGVDQTKIYCINSIQELMFTEKLEEYKIEKKRFVELLAEGGEQTDMVLEEYPVLFDKGAQAGNVDSHYFYQDIIVANIIIKSGVKLHYDVGSRIDGLVSHLMAADIDVVQYDIRDFDDINLGYGYPRLKFIKGDARDLSDVKDGTIDSISSLHAIEHFGLGRYGDDLDPYGHVRAMAALYRVLSKNGVLYLSVPVGLVEKVCFNAHRIFSPEKICKMMDRCILKEFYLIHNGKVSKYDKADFEAQKYKEVLGDYDCGIFIFVNQNRGFNL